MSDELANPGSREAFRIEFNVPRETMERLDQFIDFLENQQKSFNLVGRSTLQDIWTRHILDSAQMLPLLPPGQPVLTDLGSGAGFPGLILAILSQAEVHLVEATGKKARFLEEAARILGVEAHIHQDRIEKLQPWPTDIVTARALAPLDLLLSYARRFGNEISRKNPKCLFLKGRRFRDELKAAERNWRLKYSLLDSAIDGGGVIVAIKGFKRA